jgi:two-component system sensor histidine kinase TctE
MRQTSLKFRLLAWLLPVMVVFAATSLWLTRGDAIASANAAYDRSLLGAIKALDLNVSSASGGLAVELPYRLFEFFELTATGNVYFRVATADGLVEIGHPDLPPPPASLTAGKPSFYDASYFGESVRVGVVMRALEQPLADSTNAMLVIQVAESTASREQFTASFVRRALVRDALFFFAMGLIVVLALGRAFRPMTRLANQTQAREPHDLRPLATRDLPSDVRPLVEAVNQQIARTEALAAQRRGFIDDASHQLRTPLTTLRAQMDYVLREPDTDQRQLAVQALSDGLDHAIRATNQLLTLARTDAAQPQSEHFDLGDLTREVALALLPLARARGIDFGVELSSEQLPAKGDRELLQHALSNIAHNAIQHGRAKGVVTIMAYSDARGYSLQVSDDGPGIDASLAQRLGQRFVKNRNSQGSGLGLAIARSVIERHSGRLLIESSSPDVGVCVSLWWPKS